MSPPSPPIRLAFCITDLDPGGAERALVQIVTRLDRTRWAPVVYCLSPPGDLVAVLEAADIPVTCFGASGLRSIGVIRQLARALKQNRPQLLQTFLFHANLIGRVAARWAGVPHIVSGIRVAEKRANLHLRLDRMTNALVACNVCVSQAVADFSILRGGLSPEKTIVIPNGVDYEKFAHAQPVSLTQFGIPPDSRVVVTVGRLDPQKGLTFLLPAFSEVHAQHPDAHLLLVGEGPQREELQTLTSELGLNACVHFAGWQAGVPGILKSCDCQVLASLWEGMANVVLEGMAAGIPMLATAVEGVAEQIASGENGIVVEAGSASALAVGLNQLLADPQGAQAMAERAQVVVEEGFTWDKVAAEYDRLYAEIVGIPSLAESEDGK
ncbi:Putative glycosyltransferase EpsD [Symmachiella dynata]|uniref:glycosyltransferase n=1 Tax=Symmachiella dynata TaxID=2527995 RepID=UPI001188FD3F|nr:glycosyltransferase [Symmachiella dynata]QDT48131.1 Putative glycosyltransferase EpsD [Symmachiella dynata]